MSWSNQELDPHQQLLSAATSGHQVKNELAYGTLKTNNTPTKVTVKKITRAAKARCSNRITRASRRSQPEEHAIDMTIDRQSEESAAVRHIEQPEAAYAHPFHMAYDGPLNMSHGGRLDNIMSHGGPADMMTHGGQGGIMTHGDEMAMSHAGQIDLTANMVYNRSVEMELRRQESMEYNSSVNSPYALHMNMIGGNPFKIATSQDMNVLSIPENSSEPLLTSANMGRVGSECPTQIEQHDQQHTVTAPFPYNTTQNHFLPMYGQDHSTSRNSSQTTLRSLVCEYIDHLIDENEQLTQISEAYTMPTLLDFEHEHYFEEVRNTTHPFPSERFKQWLAMKNFTNYHFNDNRQQCDFRNKPTEKGAITIKTEVGDTKIA